MSCWDKMGGWLTVMGPLLVVIAWMAGVMGRELPVAASGLVMAATVVLGAVSVASRLNWPHTVRWLALPWFAMVGFCILAHLRDPGPLLWWWRGAEWSCSVVLFVIAVAWGMRMGLQGFARYASGMALAAVLALVLTWWGGTLGFRSVALAGFPNVNVGVNALLPVLLGGGLLSLRCGSWRWGSARWLLLAGILAWIIIVVVTGRRGAALGAVVGVGTALWIRHGAAHPRLLGIGTAILAALVLGWGAGIWSAGSYQGAGQRAFLYASALESILGTWVAGGGFYPSFRLVDHPGEVSRCLAMAGAWGVHTHSEVLEVLATGGAGALLMAVTGVGALGVLLWRASRLTREVGLPMVASALPVACIDPSYSTVIGGGILACGIGLVAGAGEARGPVASAKWRWPIGVAAVAVAAIVLANLLPLAGLAHRAPSEDRWRTARQALDPELALGVALQADGAEPQVVSAKIRLQEMALRTGWIGMLPFHLSDRAWASGDAQTVRQIEPVILARDPLFLRSAERLAAVGVDGIDPRLAARIGLLIDGMPVPEAPPRLDLMGRDGLSGSIDAVLALVARFRHDRWSEEDHAACAVIAARHGDLPTIAAMLVQIGLRTPGSAGWLAAHRAMLVRGLAGHEAFIAPLVASLEGQPERMVAYAGLVALWPSHGDVPPAPVAEALAALAATGAPQN